MPGPANNGTLSSYVNANGSGDIYMNPTGATTNTTTGTIITHTGEYFSGYHATAPTGACALNGMWVFPQSGSPTQCLSGTWTAFGGGGLGTAAATGGANGADLYVASGAVTTGAGAILTHTGEYYSGGHPTAPTGSCALNGMWAFSQDGHGSVCLSGTWAQKFSARSHTSR